MHARPHHHLKHVEELKKMAVQKNDIRKDPMVRALMARSDVEPIDANATMAAVKSLSMSTKETEASECEI
jgi:hypothetical protein